MNIYTTEEEQLQQLINWFKKNGLSLILTIVVAVSLVFAWNYWNGYKIKRTENASTLYEEFQAAKPGQERTKIANELIKNFNSSIYGKIAAVYLVNQKLAAKQFNDAAKEYEKLYKQTKLWPDLQIVVYENLVRAKIELKQIEEAYKIIKEAERNTNFIKIYPINFYNLKGDVLAKMNKNIDAIEAYNLALSAINNNPLMAKQMSQIANWITLKRNDLLAPRPLG